MTTFLSCKSHCWTDLCGLQNDVGGLGSSESVAARTIINGSNKRKAPGLTADAVGGSFPISQSVCHCCEPVQIALRARSVPLPLPIWPVSVWFRKSRKDYLYTFNSIVFLTFCNLPTVCVLCACKGNVFIHIFSFFTFDVFSPILFHL